MRSISRLATRAEGRAFLGWSEVRPSEPMKPRNFPGRKLRRQGVDVEALHPKDIRFRIGKAEWSKILASARKAHPQSTG